MTLVSVSVLVANSHDPYRCYGLSGQNSMLRGENNATLRHICPSYLTPSSGGFQS